MNNIITTTIDFFYPLAKKVMPLQTFRYAACGCCNVVLDIGLYFISYNFILHKQIVELGFIALQPHVAAFIISLSITIPVGFLLSKYVVWTASNVIGRIQFFRYLVTVFINFLINYVFIKLLVEHMNVYPTVAKIFTTGIVIIFSYLSQKHFTFKVKGKVV